MQLAMIGLGRMAANRVRRLMGDGHACVVHDARAEKAAALVDEGVPAQVLTAALDARFGSRGNADFANRVLSTMGFGFGGHREKGD